MAGCDGFNHKVIGIIIEPPTTRIHQMLLAVTGSPKAALQGHIWGMIIVEMVAQWLSLYYLCCQYLGQKQSVGCIQENDVSSILGHP